MKQLETSLRAFIDIVGMYPVKSHYIKSEGTLYYNEKGIPLNFDNRFSISSELEFFYKHCEIDCWNRTDGLKGYGKLIYSLGVSDLELFSHENLVEIHDGWSWSLPSEYNNNEFTEFSHWDSNYLIIALLDTSDAIVVDTGKKNSPVMAIIHGGGDFLLISDTFSDFLDYISITIKIVNENYYGRISEDGEDGEYGAGNLYEFVDKLKKELSKETDKIELIDNFIKFFYG